jgi:hypothetical protein
LRLHSISGSRSDRRITIIISEFNSNNGGRARSSQEQQNDREGSYLQEQGDRHHTGMWGSLLRPLSELSACWDCEDL